MSSHPGSTLRDAVALAECLKRDGYAPEQVQDYYPTPGTASTVMFYTGLDPLTMKPVFVPRDYHEKQLQRALLQYGKPQNAALVREALHTAHREDLIGTAPYCLVRPMGRTAAANAPTRGAKALPASAKSGGKAQDGGKRGQRPSRGAKAEPQGHSRPATEGKRSVKQTGKGTNSARTGAKNAQKGSMGKRGR